MSLSRFISTASKMRSPPLYEWRDWDQQSYFMGDPPDDFLAQTTGSAALGLMLATGEWIAYRFSALDSDPLPLQILQAGWAYMLNPEACRYYESDEREWRGPVRAPLAIMSDIVMDALYARDDDPFVPLRTFWMANLARYVLEDDVPAFDEWFNWAQHSLPTVHPAGEVPEPDIFDTFEPMGPPVGRDAFNPDAAYQPATAEAELRSWLTRHGAANLFLDLSEIAA